MSNYSTVTQPTTEPVAVNAAISFLRAYPDDAPVIGSLIPVAREMVEAFTGRALAPASFRLVAATWPKSEIFALERTPVTAITSVKYWPADDSAQVTMTAGTDYRAITTVTPALCQIIADLPALADRPDAIEIVFAAGADAASTPAALRHAVLLVVSHLYEQRAPVNVGNITSELPLSLRHLLESHRIGGWMG